MTAPMPREELIIKAIEGWQRNRMTTFTSSNILNDFGDEIIAALRGVAQQPWQPIETAPKDGTPVDLFSVSKKRWCNYKFDRDFPYGAWSDYMHRARHWRDRSFMYADTVTHWMPVPAPPSNQGASK